jgi:NADH:ubiquinone oxidoreductase subunit E
MPRGPKKARNIDEEIATLARQIEKQEARLKKLKSQLAALEEEREAKELKLLHEILREKGYTPAEVIHLIEKQKEEAGPAPS